MGGKGKKILKNDEATEKQLSFIINGLNTRVDTMFGVGNLAISVEIEDPVYSVAVLHLEI